MTDFREVIEILEDLQYWDTCPQEYKDRIPKLVESLALPSVMASTIPQEDANNELSTITFLIDMVDMGEFERAKKALFKAKETVNTLSDHEVYLP